MHIPSIPECDAQKVISFAPFDQVNSNCRRHAKMHRDLLRVCKELNPVIRNLQLPTRVNKQQFRTTGQVELADCALVQL